MTAVSLGKPRRRHHIDRLRSFLNQGLTPDAPDNPFAVGVHPGNSRRALEDLHLLGLEDSVDDCPYLPSRSRIRNCRDSTGLPSSAAMFRPAAPTERWHNANSLVLVEGAEVAIQPVGDRRLRRTC
jgi:hypothetical protein